MLRFSIRFGANFYKTFRVAQHTLEMATTGTSSSDESVPTENGTKARIVLQQCLSAKLQVQPATEHTDAKFVEINRGLLVYLCFLKGASWDMLEKMVKCVLSTRLSGTSDGKLVSILDLPGDVLIVPQATLGGRPKGKVMQYHNNIEKTEGLKLYTDFAEQCSQIIERNTKCKEAGTTVKWGTYGNTQVLSIVTNGPYTHLIEF